MHGVRVCVMRGDSMPIVCYALRVMRNTAQHNRGVCMVVYIHEGEGGVLGAPGRPEGALPRGDQDGHLYPMYLTRVCVVL